MSELKSGLLIFLFQTSTHFIEWLSHQGLNAKGAWVPPDLQEALDANPKAAAFFATLGGANRYAILYRIGAVKSQTRRRKIGEFVGMLEHGETLHG